MPRLCREFLCHDCVANSYATIVSRIPMPRLCREFLCHDCVANSYATIVSRILYALPAFYGFILQSDVDRIDAMFKKAKRWEVTTDEFSMNFHSTLSDSLLFKNIKFDQHCLHHLLPQVHEVPSYNLRGRPTSYEIPRGKISKLLNSFIYRCANLNY